MSTLKKTIGPVLRLLSSRVWLVIAMLALISPILVAQSGGRVSTDHLNSNGVGNSSSSASISNSFEVAAIRRSSADSSGWRLQFTVDGFIARNVSLSQLIKEAFGIYEDDRFDGGPAWIDSTKFDVDAKVDSSLAGSFQDLSLADRREMLMTLLADRFALRAHRVKKVIPVYELVLAGSSLKLHQTKPDDSLPTPIKGIGGLVTRSTMGELEVRDYSMSNFAQYLSFSLNRPVIDRTGLSQHYDFSLHWIPEEARSPDSGSDLLPSAPLGLSIFSAIQQQLGLKLQSTKSPMDSIMIDQAQMPAAN